MVRKYKLVVYAPIDEADSIRELLGKLGAGKIGKYDYASFSVRGTGRFRPLKEARPSVGEVGKIEDVAEERIETVVGEEILKKVVSGLRKAHSYEEPVIDVIPLISPPKIGGD